MGVILKLQWTKSQNEGKCFQLPIQSMCFPDSSVDKESACNAGDPGSVLGLGRSAGEGIGYHSSVLGLPLWLSWKISACNSGDLGLIPGLGRSTGEGKGYPLQYSGLENSMGFIVHSVSMSWTRLNDFHFHTKHSEIVWTYFSDWWLFKSVSLTRGQKLPEQNLGFTELRSYGEKKKLLEEK